jgi:DNA polymerase-1
MNRLLVIDGHAIVYRAFHALPALTAKDGTPTNAVYGFFGMLYSAIQDLKPDHLIVCFDTPAPTYRNQIFPDYRANRPSQPDDLRPQFPVIKELLDAAEMVWLEKDGAEADDLIGTIAQTLGTGDIQVLVLTGDRDLLQLVNDNVRVVMPKVGMSSIAVFDEKDVIEKFDVTPEQMVDYKALAGDASDNYSGVPGLGPKTAVKLIKRFGTVEGIYEHLDEIAEDKLRAKLKENEEAARLFKRIAAIDCEVDISIPWERSRLQGFGPGLREAFEKRQFNTLLRRYFGGTAPANPAPKKESKVEPDPTDQGTLF